MHAFTKSLLALAVIGAAALVPKSASAQAVTVDVDITIGSITILYYHNDINVNIPSAVLASLFTPPGCVSNPSQISCIDAVPGPGFTDATFAGPGVLNWPGGVTAIPAPPNFTSVDLNLSNVWAVRALGGTSANTTVTIGGAGGIAGVSGSIGVVSRSIATGATAVCAAGTTATFADPGLGIAQVGSVCLELDFTAAAVGPFAGTGPTGDAVYTLQVTGT